MNCKSSMEHSIKIINKVLFILSLLVLPIMFIGGLYGLAGETASYYVLIWLGYVGLIISSSVCLKWHRFFPFVVISLLVIGVGIALDTMFWSNENRTLCAELRSNKTCVEDVCGFTCSDFYGGGFMIGGSVCADKNPELCKKDI